MFALATKSALGAKMRFSCRTDSMVAIVDLLSNRQG
jgi:hypothetical protein